MEKFDVLKWIRDVRDRHHREQEGLSVEERIRRTEDAAEKFRSSRRKASGRQAEGQG